MGHLIRRQGRDQREFLKIVVYAGVAEKHHHVVFIKKLNIFCGYVNHPLYKGKLDRAIV
jgi:hypothetical protein